MRLVRHASSGVLGLVLIKALAGCLAQHPAIVCLATSAARIYFRVVISVLDSAERIAL
jgi:hypothetical protein